MGQIRIEMVGSFSEARIVERRSPQSFSAMDHGHAAAVARAIEWLSAVAMPAAIALDHRLHTEGEAPSRSWGMDE